MIEHGSLVTSLRRQRQILEASIVLTPVDSLPLAIGDRAETAFLHGLYLTDKVRSPEEQRRAVIQFAGRGRAACDLDRIHGELATQLGARAASMRLLSGLHAHAVVFMSISAPGERVMVLPEEGGGHFSTPAILRRLGLDVVYMPLDRARRCVDRRATLELAAAAKPHFVFVDRSEGLRFEDFSFLSSIGSAVRIFDASQYLPQILSGHYTNPLEWQFDLMLFSLHKSFPGPQKAGVVSAGDGKLWRQLVSGLSTFVSSSHAENTYIAGLTLARRAQISELAHRICSVADGLRDALREVGVDAVGAAEQGDPDWPTTQHAWIRCRDADEAFRMYSELGRARIQTNYRLLPYGMGYGLRLGTTYAAAAGLSRAHVPELAGLVAAIIADGASPARRHAVRALARRARASAIDP